MILKHRFNSFRDLRWLAPEQGLQGLYLWCKFPWGLAPTIASGAEARALLSNTRYTRVYARSSRCYVVTPLTINA